MKLAAEIALSVFIVGVTVILAGFLINHGYDGGHKSGDHVWPAPGQPSAMLGRL
jgi:hypothetical protein